MPSSPTSNTNGGTGQPARPGVSAPSSTSTEVGVSTEDWEDWYCANNRDRRGLTPLGAVFAATAAKARGRRRIATLVMGAAAVLAVFSAGVLYVDLSSPHKTAAAVIPAVFVTQTVTAPPASPSPETVVVQPVVNVPVMTQPLGNVRGAPPVRISIPELKIDQRLIGLSVNANRQLEVPRSYNDIGWWSTGPVPGAPGAAVIVGHVDSMVGPAVFYRLSSLTRGDIIAVRRSDGTTVKFTVTTSQLFAKDHFPDKLVYRTTGRPSLHLVTCGGSYDRSTGYHDNVVVFADLIHPKPAPKRRLLPHPPARPRRSPPPSQKPRSSREPRPRQKP